MSADAPLVSVVVPAHNAAEFLDDCVRSVRAQSLDAWELLLVDNASSDATPALAHAWVARDARVRLLQLPRAGVSAARNAGAAAARAPLIAFLDADDRWCPDKLRSQRDYMHRHRNAGISFTRARFLGPDGNATAQFSVALRGPVRPASMLYGNPATTCSSVMVRSEVFARSGGFDPELAFAEDLEWMLRTACVCRTEVHALDRALTLYRTNPGGQSARLERMHEGWEAMLARAGRFAPELVAAHGAAARASHLCYLARRAVRLGLPASRALGYLGRSLSADRSVLLREPRRLIGTLAAALARGAADALGAAGGRAHRSTRSSPR